MKFLWSKDENRNQIVQIFFENDLNLNSLQRIVRDEVVKKLTEDYLAEHSVEILNQVKMKEVVNISTLQIATHAINSPQTRTYCPRCGY